MSHDDKLLLTPEQAINLLADEGDIHNFIQSGMLFLGCDFSRDDAIKAFHDAKSIEIGGENCKQMRHPLAVYDRGDKLSFFEADMAKVEAFEAAIQNIGAGA